MEIMALVDTGSQISSLTEGSCSEFGLRILPLGDLLHLEGTGVSITIPYKEHIEASLTI